MKKIVIRIYLKINLQILNLRIYLVSKDLELALDPEDETILRKKLDYLLSEASKTLFLLDIL